MEVDDAVFEIMKDDVSAILRNSRPHARLQQFLDLRHDFVPVFFGHCRTVRSVRKQDRPAGGKVLHDRLMCSCREKKDSKRCGGR